MDDGPDKTNGAEPVTTALRNTVFAHQEKVLISLPWYKSTNAVTAFALAALADKRRTSLSLCAGDAFVAHSRNTCADIFLASEYPWQLTLDDDMIFPFGDAKAFKQYTGFRSMPDQFAGLNTLDRLLSHKKTLVGALYFGRSPYTSRAMYAEGCNNPAEAKLAHSAPVDQVKPTRWVATGCMLIHRQVYLDIEKKFPRLARGSNGKGGNWFTSSEHTATDWIDRTRKMLSEGPMTGDKAFKALEMLERAAAEARGNSCLGQGEDVAFCVRAAAAGHQPHVDLGLLCGHLGQKVYGPQPI